MSYEGYVQRLCAKGHYCTVDCYFEDDELTCFCGAPWAWRNGVDQTNDDGEQFVADLEVDVPAVTETCKCCGNVKTLEPVRYKIPTMRSNP